MKFLFVSDFLENPNSGSAGSLLSIGAALRTLGHQVDYEWHEPRQKPRLAGGLAQTMALPGLQLRQTARRLAQVEYDAVVISQPYGYKAFEKLRPRFPNTLFLNRTHGWEERVYQAYRTHQWDGPRPLSRRVLSLGAERMVRRVCARTAKASDGIIAASSRCANFVRERHAGLAPHVQVIPYGLDADFVQHKPMPMQTQSVLKFLYVGNYLPIKGSLVLESVISTLAPKHDNFSLSVITDAIGRRRVEERLGKTLGPRLHSYQWVGRESLPDIYSAHDVLLYPSLFEGFGKAWLEAMACGRCVVGFAEGGLPDIAENERDALYCEAGDHLGLTNLLERCLVEPNLVRTIGDRAVAVARSYTWQQNAKATIDFCNELRNGLV